MKKRIWAITVILIISVCLSACINGNTRAVIDRINALGEVTLQSGPELDAAAEAYAALSIQEKAGVSNIDILLKKTKELQTLTEAEMERQLRDARVKQAEEAIEQLKILPENSYEGIRNASRLVSSLSAEEKELVSNLSLLTYAKEKYCSSVEKQYRAYMDWYATPEAEAFLKEQDPEILEDMRDVLRDCLDDYCVTVVAEDDGSLRLPEDSAYMLKGLTKPVLEMYSLIGIPETDGYVKFLNCFSDIQQDFIDWRHFQEMYEIWAPDFGLIYSRFTSAVDSVDREKAYSAVNEMAELAMDAKEAAVSLDSKYVSEYAQALSAMNIHMKLILSALEMQNTVSYESGVQGMLKAVEQQEEIYKKYMDFLDRKDDFLEVEMEFISTVLVNYE